MIFTQTSKQGNMLWRYNGGESASGTTALLCVSVWGKERSSLALISIFCPPVNALWPAVSWPASQCGNKLLTEKQPKCICCQLHAKATTEEKDWDYQTQNASLCPQHTLTEERTVHLLTKLETIVLLCGERKCQPACLCLDCRSKLKCHVSWDTSGELRPCSVSRVLIIVSKSQPPVSVSVCIKGYEMMCGRGNLHRESEKSTVI